MNIIFCSDPLNRKQVDCEWELEFSIAKKYTKTIYYVNYEALTDEKNINKALKHIIKPSKMELCIYRGWMMTLENYEMLYNGLLDRNLQLINSPSEYKNCHYFPEYYNLISSVTPQSVCTNKQHISLNELQEILKNFGSKAIIIKDHVKSQKHHWFEACYIPNANDIHHAEKVVKKFVELQGNNFEGGLGIHPRSQMPLTMEYRIFMLNGAPISMIKYWDEGDYNYDNQIPIEKFNTFFKKIKSNFFTVDIAKLTNGEWVIIELGDAQVAEFMDVSGLEPFYQQLLKVDD